jgi:galactose mutarotase-like enzyme
VIHRIENNKLQLAVKRYGAEIYSIKSASTGREFIWDANPKIWANHAPILFPIVGALKRWNLFLQRSSIFFAPARIFQA